MSLWSISHPLSEGVECSGGGVHDSADARALGQELSSLLAESACAHMQASQAHWVKTPSSMQVHACNRHLSYSCV